MTAHVIQIETLKNVKCVPAKELVTAIMKITVYYVRVYSRRYVDSLLNNIPQWRHFKNRHKFPITYDPEQFWTLLLEWPVSKK